MIRRCCALKASAQLRCQSYWLLAYNRRRFAGDPLKAMRSLRRDLRTAATNHSPARKKAADAAELALADMVSAVTQGKSFGDISLKFDLRGRPVVGEPVDIDLAIIPAHEVDSLSATFQPGEGLDVAKGGKTPEISHPQVGVPISHTLTVVPQRDGVFYVNAVVVADSASQSVSRTFSIPLIAGNGSAVAATPAPAARGVQPPAAQAH
jgi:hypothetical protein